MAFADLVGVAVLAAIGGLTVKYFGDRRRSSDSSASLAGAAVTVSFLCVLAVVEGHAPGVLAVMVAPPGSEVRSALIDSPQSADHMDDLAVSAAWTDADPFSPETVGGVWPGAGLAASSLFAEGDDAEPTALGLYVPEWMVWHDTSPAPAAASTTTDGVDHEILAGRDTLALLQLARRKYDESVSDYTATLSRRLRDDDGTFGPQESMQCRFRQEPFNVFLKWNKGAGKVDKALYAPALHGPQLHVHPTGLAGFFAPVVKVDLDGRYAKTAGGITQFGFAHTLERLIARGAGARVQGELSESYLGVRQVGGRPTLALQWRLPQRDDYPYGRIVVQLDRESLLPLSIAMWDWNDELQAEYVYENVTLNVGLDDADFSLRACGLGL
ncbi:MAG: DUF1571 domain-containing protein [Planctomycetes bacterium]|nr:DUF1571 domain-containing protein [Planctomycetota bacterium]